MKPGIGRIVHFGTAERLTPRGVEVDVAAALVVRVDRERRSQVDLQVFRPDGEIEFVSGIRQSPEPELGRWSWPAREE